MCDVHLVKSFHPATVVCHASRWSHVSFRVLKDRGSTRSISKAQLVPLRFSWSTRTHPVPPPLCCQFLLQTKSSKASQHQRPPLSLLFPRSTQLSIFSYFYFWTYQQLPSLVHITFVFDRKNIELPFTTWWMAASHSHDRGLSLCNSPFFSFRFWEQLQQLLQNRPLLQQPSRQSHLQVGINRVMGWVLHLGSEISF